MQDFMDMFCDMMSGNDKSSNNNDVVDLQYMEARKKSNLKLYKMKSGKYQVKDYYLKNVGDSFISIIEAKKFFIKITL